MGAIQLWPCPLIYRNAMWCSCTRSTVSTLYLQIDKYHVLMSKLNTKLFAFALLFVAMASCKKEDDQPTPPPTNESELITTVVLTFTDPELNETFELRFRDLDGEGGNEPVITMEPLPVGRAFNLRVRVLDESSSSPVELTNEILSEANEHQFFFAVEGAALAISYSDQDGNGRPLGLSNLAISGAASSGTLKVTLRHDLDKEAEGVSAGDITNAGGDTDIEVTFPLVLE